MIDNKLIKYNKENSELLKSFLENTFFKSFFNKKRGCNDNFCDYRDKLHNFNSIELDFDYKCNLNCSYCYYSRFGKELFRTEKIDYNVVLNNLKKFMKFVVKNKVNCELELFSGDIFNLPIWREIFDIIYNGLFEVEENYRIEKISIPSNISSIIENNTEKEVINIVEKFRKNLNVYVGFSASFDGPFMDQKNRKMISGKKYNLEHYNKIIKFMKDTFTCSHPMLYSNNNEFMFDNILWFTNSTSILGTYLLQVRNPEWDKDQLKNFYYSIRAYLFSNYIKADKNLELFKAISGRDNISLNSFGFIGRGLGCSMQSALYIQLHDMSIIPCHRLSYDGQVAGKLIINEDGSYDVEAGNVELLLAVMTVDREKMGICENCIINTICSGTCLGSNYESTGDPFVPHPQVCLLEFVRISAIVHELANIGFLNKKNIEEIYYLNPVKAIQIINLIDLNIDNILDKF